ncbi:SH3 domain-containing protein 19 isoform X2 [Falco rusticolus]|uniref:SH3 domain-containing protein 19 isoform X2 n=1 Tax=Falco rusticolus TaxID=120794 RepID=UPI00188653CF|nr:SH3 domain-containing protein 19 isoform X2 [Falco rusticolus]XP_055578776.1 SH3 domain-containing protein 19 isoform X2 [Falco cherrug]
MLSAAPPPPMAEAWRLEEDEEELRELGRRHRRVALSSAADRSERNKPDCRSSGQGPLSSIRAAIKRSSRTSSHSEQQRDRRRPEITIVAAEPLRPSSWFPGASPVAPQGLGFPSASSHAQWRRNEHIPAELPPSYEQVIKEINQVQVNTTNNNNAAAPRHTTTSATQTDFPEELISRLPGSNVKTSVPTHWESAVYPVQSPLKPPRPSASLLNRSPSENENPLIVFEISEGQRCQENPNAVICPVPKPRSRSNLRPVVKNTESKIDDGEEVNQPTTKRQQPPVQESPLLDDSLLDNHLVMDSMSTEKSQNSIVSRIKVFESQGTNDTSGLSKKPEIAPRSFAPRPVTAKKPVVAPKPGVSRISGDWDAWTESKSTPSKELQPQPEVVGSSVTTKPELPKKPKPGLVKSSSSDFLDARSGSVAENSDGQKKFPVPAPRPLVPKKSFYAENPALPLASLRPIAAPPRASISGQEKVFKSLGESSPAANSSAPTLQNKLDVEEDLISFDDDVLPLSPACVATNNISSEAAADPFQFVTKSEPAKEQAAQPALARKPTVIRIPAKPRKSLNDIPHSPPPLPAEKPIGNTLNITVGKPDSADLVKKVELDHSEQGGVAQLEPVLPPRPVDGKIIPARPPPPKSVPGRPPPPKLSAAKTTSQKDVLSRSASDIAPDKKPSKFRLGPKRAKSSVFKNPDPALPPRPKPGHPLYNKYMVRTEQPVPHGVAKEDCLPRNTGELSCKDSNHPPKVSNPSVPHAVVLHDFPAEHADDLNLHSGDTVCLLEKIDTEWYRGKCGSRTGIFPASFVKVVIDVPEEGNRKKIPCSSRCIKGPRCVARFEYIGDQKDELSFSEGETIILKGYVNEEWAKGELRGSSGIFPLNFVEVIEDLPGTGTGAALKNKVEVSSSLPQNNRLSTEWCEALHDFTAETKDDLSFKKGDYIQILEQVDSEWYRGRLNEKEGIFPAVFVQTCSAARVELSQSVGGKKGKAKALYDFHGENEDELSFKAGDTITELESVDEDWMSGEIQGKSGIFPKNFVQILKTQ